MKKLPWGIFSGISAMLVFFLTLGFVGLYFVLGAIAGQTHSDFSIFQNWWQVLMFIFDILFFGALIFSLVMYFQTRKEKKGEIDDEEAV